VSALCVRPPCFAAGKAATERIRVSFGTSVWMRPDGTHEEQKMEFVSEPLCRACAVELTLSVATMAGAVELPLRPESVPLHYEDELAAARRLFREMGL
jgi:hypothetical protein